jgi:hypothetical protein
MIAVDLVFTLAGTLFAFIPSPSPLAHRYEIASPTFFKGENAVDQAAGWALELKRKIIEAQVPHCEFKDMRFHDLVKAADPTMEIIRVEMKDLGQEQEMTVSVISQSDDGYVHHQPCGTKDAELCANMFQKDVADDVGTHERLCHKGGKTCGGQK